MDLRSATLVRRSDARTFLEGPERCTEYLRGPWMWFGTSTLPTGKEGAMDPGHPASIETFYCTTGRILVHDGRFNTELVAGDALIIPKGVPHAIRNLGPETAFVVWAGAPVA